MIFVDFHAEATAEKIAMKHCLDGKVTALFGTHTHVQTADEKILEKLMEARRFLCEKGCANEDNDNGHSDEAENLKKDIDKMIEELQKDKLPKDEDKKDNKNNNKEKEKNQKYDSKMSKKKKELEEIEKKGREEREDSLTDLRNFYSDKYYYDGKQW